MVVTTYSWHFAFLQSPTWALLVKMEALTNGERRHVGDALVRHIQTGWLRLGHKTALIELPRPTVGVPCKVMLSPRNGNYIDCVCAVLFNQPSVSIAPRTRDIRPLPPSNSINGTINKDK